MWSINIETPHARFVSYLVSIRQDFELSILTNGVPSGCLKASIPGMLCQRDMNGKDHLPKASSPGKPTCIKEENIWTHVSIHRAPYLASGFGHTRDLPLDQQHLNARMGWHSTLYSCPDPQYSKYSPIFHIIDSKFRRTRREIAIFIWALTPCWVMFYMA